MARCCSPSPAAGWWVVGVVDGFSAADPFTLSADALELLKLRAKQEGERRFGRGPLLGRLMLIRQRAGLIA